MTLVSDPCQHWAVFRMLRGPVATRSEGPAGSAPMSVVQDQPSVDVRVAGQGPFRFLIDTGAAGAGRISAELVERLGLKEAGEVLVGDPSGRNAATRSLVRVPELTFAGRSWKDLDMLVAGDDAEIPGIAGILGFAMFGDVLLTLDYPGKQVRLQSGALPPADGREVLEFVSEHGIPAIEIDLAGTKVLADLDSGSMGWVMVPGQMAESMPLAETPRVVGRASTAFNEFEIRSARLNGRLRVGGHEIENPPVEFADLFPRGNVGGQFLGQFAVSFDQENRRVRFTRSGEEPLVRKPRYRIGAMIGMGPDGWKIEGVVAGSPAERAGLRTGDRIARVNGTPVEELAGEASARMLGSPDEVVLDVLRGEETLELRLTPEPM